MACSQLALQQPSSPSHHPQDDRFGRLLESNIIGIVVANSERIEVANDAFLTMIGYDRDDLERGTISWRALTPPEYSGLDDRALAELTQRGECTPFRKEYMRKDGTRVPVLIGAVAIEREPLEAVCFVIDRTSQHQLELTLAAALKEKETLLRQQETLFQEVNHRIKNNLQIVSSLLAIQRSRVQAPEAKAALGEAIGRVSAIAAVHARLYAVGNVTDVEMGSYLRALCEDAARSGMVDATRCRIEVVADPFGLPTSRATSVALIVTELLMNIAKYCVQAANIVTVVVRLRRSNSGMRLEVEDDGPGMPSDYDPGQNAGLGLKLVLALARQNDGDVRFEARNPGTRVVIDWPCEAMHAPERQQAAAAT